jgi:hypothetical protein
MASGGAAQPANAKATARMLTMRMRAPAPIQASVAEAQEGVESPSRKAPTSMSFFSPSNDATKIDIAFGPRLDSPQFRRDARCIGRAAQRSVRAIKRKNPRMCDVKAEFVTIGKFDTGHVAIRRAGRAMQAILPATARKLAETERSLGHRDFAEALESAANEADALGSKPAK